MRPVALTASLLGLLAVGLEAEAAGSGYAIVIGNNASPPEEAGLKPLRFADDDALRYAEVLGRVAGHVHLLTVLDASTQRRHPGLAARTRPPTYAAVLEAVADVKARLQSAPGVVYLVFSGHGSNDARGEPYLALLDRGLTRSALFDEVLSELRGAREVHLVVDACNAGAVVGVRGAFDAEVDATATPLSEATRAAVIDSRSLDRFPNVGAIIATSAGQASHEWSRIESGVFTHELLSGLVGPADINGDLRIEYSELQAFVGAANSGVADPRARPSVRAIPPARDHRAPLLSLAPLDGPFLRGDLGRLGHFFIELGGGRRYLDAHLGSQRKSTVLLPRATAGYLRTDRAEAELPASDGGIVDVDDLDFREVRLSSRGALDATFRDDLFASPFDVAYYRGFVDSRALVSADLEVEATLPLAERWTVKEAVAVTLWATAGAGAISAVVTGILAADTEQQFQATTAQRTATELANRYDALLAATVVGAAVAALGAGGGVALWLNAQPSSNDQPAVALAGISGTF